MNITSYVLFSLGLTAMLIGSVGIAKLPDIYSRLQSSGASDTAGIITLMLGFIFHNGFTFSDVFLGLLIAFFFITGPIITHTITKAAFLSKVEPSQNQKEGKK